MKKALSIIGDVILGLIIILAVFGIIFALSQKKDRYGVAEVFGYSAYAVPTDSMVPTINPGDLVFGDSSVTYDDLEVGDVIFFYYVEDDNVIVKVHRIYDEAYDSSNNFLGYVTKGDNEEVVDNVLITENNYIATWTGSRVPWIGAIVTFLTTQVGFLVCIILPIFLYLIYQIFRLVKVVMNNKKVDMMEAAASGVESEEIKEAIIQEYLRKQEELKAKELEATGAEEKKNK